MVRCQRSKINDKIGHVQLPENLALGVVKCGEEATPGGVVDYVTVGDWCSAEGTAYLAGKGEGLDVRREELSVVGCPVVIEDVASPSCPVGALGW